MDVNWKKRGLEAAVLTGLTIASLPAAGAYLGHKLAEADDYDEQIPYYNQVSNNWFIGFIGGIVGFLATAAILHASSPCPNYKPEQSIVAQEKIHIDYQDKPVSKETTSSFLLSTLTNYTITQNLFFPALEDCPSYTSTTHVTLFPSEEYKCEYQLDGHVPLERLAITDLPIPKTFIVSKSDWKTYAPIHDIQQVETIINDCERVWRENRTALTQISYQSQ